MSSATSSRTGLRADIQVLRAVAVMFVVLFHLWPGLVPGGFVGVDVFFVISGFLITSHLFSETARTGTIKLRSFWARRARRLLPSAFLVILATSIMVFVFQPSALWPTFVRQAVASTFYFENWALAADATNYLAADKPPTAVQQFWSLSVEEQFYIVWPLLLIGSLLIVRAFARMRRSETMLAVLGLVSLASLIYSIQAVWRGDSTAYFSTFSRAWEFGAGGLIGLIVARGKRTDVSANIRQITWWRPVVAVTGWAGLAVSLFVINPTTPFPGVWALLPVASTSAVILARWNRPVPRMLRAPLVAAVWLGGISYAVYLWHWPLIVIYPYATHHAATSVAKIGLLAITILVAWLVTRFIEGPIRNAPFLAEGKPWRTATVMLVASALILVPSVTAFSIQSATAAQNAKVGASLAKNTCFGAGTIDHAPLCANKTWPILQPDPAFAIDDRSVLYSKKCISDTERLIECHFGSENPKIRIALIGDSHAASIYPALESAYAGQDASITTFTKFSCVFSQAVRSHIYDSCVSWVKKLEQTLANRAPFDVVVVTGYATNLAEDVDKGILTADQAKSGFEATWRELTDRGSRVVVIRDNPEWPTSPSSCLSANKDPLKCSVSRSSIYSVMDYQFEAARNVPWVSALDLSTYYCSVSECAAATGGVTMYLDRSHLSATYAQTLGPALALRLQPISR